MKRLNILTLLLCIALHGWAADPKFPVTDIPENLRKDVNVVVREHRATFRILARNQATYSVYKVITIFNEQGNDHAREVIGYDKLIKVRAFTATSYDAAGKYLKRVKNSEIYDQSVYDGGTLFSDSRLKSATLVQGNFPYTVEFAYELEFRYLYHIPRFHALSEEKMAVQKASYTLEYLPSLKPKYKAINIDKAPVPGNNGVFESVSWEFENLLPVKKEPHGPSNDHYIPIILAAPSKFEYDAYVGSMDTWDEFGQWIGSLNKGRDQLPDATKQKILELTAGLTTTEEKTRALYQYMQGKTRYVGIQLGIGGYQPFEASVVDQTGYGDCKALSNYMVSMLKTVGIPSHYVLVYAGPYAPALKADFVSSQFNHAVVAVPNGMDTLWLECTSQTVPFGYAGHHTGNRKALIITDTGAKIVSTPRYLADDNVQSTRADVTVDLNGNGRASVTTYYKGLQYENGGLDNLLDNQFDEQKKWVLNNTKIPSFDLSSFKFSNHKDKIPMARLDMELSLSRLANVSGKRIFLTPNLMNRSNYIPEKAEGRKTQVVRHLAFTDVDSIRYHLPEGIYPEFLPENVKLSTRFGEYEASYHVDQGNLLYIRKLKMKQGAFPPESYQEFIDFYKNMSKADNTKIVFMSKT